MADHISRIISERHEAGAIIITSIKPFEAWGEMFADPILATAVLDWLVHHAYIIPIMGERGLDPGITGLLGPNGVGMSTLMRTFRDRPHAGRLARPTIDTPTIGERDADSLHGYLGGYSPIKADFPGRQAPGQLEHIISSVALP